MLIVHLPAGVEYGFTASYVLQPGSLPWHLHQHSLDSHRIETYTGKHEKNALHRSLEILGCFGAGMEFHQVIEIPDLSPLRGKQGISYYEAQRDVPTLEGSGLYHRTCMRNQPTYLSIPDASPCGAAAKNIISTLAGVNPVLRTFSGCKYPISAFSCPIGESEIHDHNRNETSHARIEDRLALPPAA